MKNGRYRARLRKRENTGCIGVEIPGFSLLSFANLRPFGVNGPQCPRSQNSGQTCGFQAYGPRISDAPQFRWGRTRSRPFSLGLRNFASAAADVTTIPEAEIQATRLFRQRAPELEKVSDMSVGRKSALFGNEGYVFAKTAFSSLDFDNGSMRVGKEPKFRLRKYQSMSPPIDRQ